jgi:hypothetical protein
MLIFLDTLTQEKNTISAEHIWKAQLALRPRLSDLKETYGTGHNPAIT